VQVLLLAPLVALGPLRGPEFLQQACGFASRPSGVLLATLLAAGALLTLWAFVGEMLDYLESVGRMDAAGTLVQRRIPWDEWEEQARRWSRIAWDPLRLLESFPWKSRGWESRVTGPAREYWR
jgi:hypothetical protein